MLGTLLLCMNFQLVGITVPLKENDKLAIVELNRQCMEDKRRCLQVVIKIDKKTYKGYCGPLSESI